nr:unnamed protein product [Callosobruchus chinensis]
MSGNRRSSIWEYFTKLSDEAKAKCNICAVILSLNGAATSNITRHMKLKHPTINLSESRKRKLSVTEEEEQTEKPINASIKEVILNKQNNINSSHLKQRHSVDNQLLKLIVKDYQPFNIVDSKDFQKLVNMLNPNYELPSRKVLSNTLLNNAYEKVFEDIRIELQNVEYVSITTDGWTSLNNESFYAITCHFIDDNCKLQSRLLSSFKFSGQHTSENITQQIQSILSQWEIQNKIVACITDNAANMVKAVRLANWWHIPCFAHSLNLIVQAGLLEIAELLTNIKSIVEFFKHSSSATEKLQNMQKRMGFEVLKLKQDCPTRWNSTFDMLNRLRKMKEPLQSTLGILNNSALPQLNTEDWYMVEKCCDILSIFNEITIEVSSEKNVTSPKIAIISKNLINYCTRLKSENFESQFITNMVSKLYDEVVTRYKKKYRNIPIIWEATLLDPRFKQHGFHTNSK